MKTCERCHTGTYRLTRPKWAGRDWTDWPLVSATIKEHEIQDEPVMNWYGPMGTFLFVGLYHCNECGYTHAATKELENAL
jgi:hypothetical protein